MASSSHQLCLKSKETAENCEQLPFLHYCSHCNMLCSDYSTPACSPPLLLQEEVNESLGSLSPLMKIGQ